MTRIVSADLAYRTYRDTGIAVLDASDDVVECVFVDAAVAGLSGDPSPDVLAEFLAQLCSELGATLLTLDGPQAWKDPNNGLEHSRLCERALGTPAKTGVPGVVKPGNYLPFVAFAIAVFDALQERGWPRYAGEIIRNGHKAAVETFPMSAWKSLGFTILPAKAKCRPAELAVRHDALCDHLPLRVASTPNHDELQALISGLGGVGLCGSPRLRAERVGVAPYQLEGVWREGFIVNPAYAS